MGIGNLPDGWTSKTVDDLYEVIGGGTPSTAVPEYWNGDIPWITSADIADLKDIRPRKYITHDAIANSATSLAPAGSLIVVTRVSLGKVALADYPLCFSQDSQALIAKGKDILPDYALYYLSQATQIFKYQSRGTTISGVTKKQLKELPFPLPPLPEQERIVAKIEELFTQLEAGAAALKRVRAGLKRYKASVLKAAVEGRLLNDEFRMQNDELPNGWRWTKVGDIGKVKGGKRLPAGHTYSDEKTAFPYIRVVDFGESSIESDELKYLKPETQKQIKQYIISRDDVYISIAGSIGKVGVIPDLLEGANLTENAAKITELQDMDNKFLAYVLASPIVQEQIAALTIATTQPKLALFRIEKIDIPLPPLAEQRRIVAEVERRLSAAQEVESVVAASVARAGRLRQSVLKSAFEGRLC